MANFALSTSDPYGEVVSSLNYVLANLGQGGTVDGNVLVGNVQTGEITSNGSVISYLYQYMDVQYANNSTGSSGFSSNSINKGYYGLRNTSNVAISFNPADYVWYQVTGGFGTTKSLWYQTIGGRQLALFAGNAAPDPSFIATPDMPFANSSPINLDTITSAQNNQIVNVSAYYQDVTTPATPSGGTYDFSTFVLTPPSGWSASPPGFVANTSVYISQAAFVGNSVSTVGPATTWTVPVVYSEQFQGNAGPAGERGFLPLGFVITASDPTGYTDTQLNVAFSSSRTSSTPPIGLGFAPIANDTAQFFYQDLFNPDGDVTLVKQFNGSTWVDVVGEVISGGLVVPGSITANTLNANQVYALTVASTNANVGNIASPGYWFQANTGNGRFGGNLNIGNNLVVGANAQISSNLNVGSSAVIGANLTVGANANIGNNLTVGTNAVVGAQLTVGANANIGSNLIVGTNATIGANLSVTGLITQGSLANAVVTTASLADGSVNGVKIANGVITGEKIAANTITGNNIQAGSIYGNSIVANSFSANTINGNAIIAGSLTLTGNLASADATVGDVNSPGYWLEYGTGSARFGGNVSIGEDLIVGNLITASALNASTVGTEVLVINSATQQIYVQDDPEVNIVPFVNGSTTDITSPDYLWPNNTRGFGVGGGATIIPATTGNIGQSGIQVVYTAYVTTLTNTEYNLVELWKDGPSASYTNTFRRVIQDDEGAGNIAPVDVNKFWVGGDNGSVGAITANAFTLLSANANYVGRGTVTNTLYTAFSSSPNGGAPGTWPTDTPNPTYVAWGAAGSIWNNNIVGASPALQLWANAAPSSAITTYDVALVDCYPSSGGVVRQAGIAVGNGGQIYRASTTMATGSPSDINTVEASGTFADLYSVTNNYGGYNYTNSSDLVWSIAVGTSGTILENYRTFTVTGNSTSRTNGSVLTSSSWTKPVSGTTNDLNGVATNATKFATEGALATAWIIVGNNGTILTASSAEGSGPGSWTARDSNTTRNLRAVNEALNRWVAVGDAGTIITSTDNGATWTSPLSNPADGSGGIGSRNLYGIAGDANTGRWVACGQELVMMSDTSDPSAGWTVLYDGGLSYQSQLTRLVYNGSWANIANVSQPPAQQRISNQQVISGSYVDYDYSAGVPVTYYLVLGNMAGSEVYTGAPSLLVTEIKR